jgi:hypothetical protein
MPSESATGSHAGMINVAIGDFSTRRAATFLNSTMATGVTTTATDNANTHHVLADQTNPNPPSAPKNTTPATGKIDAALRRHDECPPLRRQPLLIKHGRLLTAGEKQRTGYDAVRA